jgi:hypothetical protein
MQLEHLITLANRKTCLFFYAMERSLRATGCSLPIRVIPYDDERFDLPKGSSWLESEDFFTWLNQHNTPPMMRKYRCLFEQNFQYVDSDVIFLQNPFQVLQEHSGFITSCGHWHNPQEACTPATASYFGALSTNWQRCVFNSGQFACDTALYTPESLKEICKRPLFADTCLRFPFHDQPGINLLVYAHGVPITNLTLPPFNMPSTWAGDYLDARHYQDLWHNANHPTLQRPYLMHWAGRKPDGSKRVDQLFFDHLSTGEKALYLQDLKRTEPGKAFKIMQLTLRACRQSAAIWATTLGQMASIVCKKLFEAPKTAP